LLLLDSFSAHWTAQTSAKLLELGISTYKIPPGCTYLVQPIDVGIGKPFKDRVRSFWWEWMLAQGADRSTFVNASRELGSKWVADGWDSIPEAIVRNSWRKSDFSYFVDE
jgi:DDE superfamily endonuclease